MDVTHVFKACLKTVKTRNRALGVNISADKSTLLQPKKKYEFQSKAKDIVANITKLGEFLAEHRKAYINTDHLTDSTSMTDNDRDQIDFKAELVTKTCSQILKEFRKEVMQMAATSQVREHQHSVLLMIEDYLKRICEKYSEQRAIRIKRTVEMQKILRLQPDDDKDGLKSRSVDMPSLSSLSRKDGEFGESDDHLKKTDNPFSLDDDTALSNEEIQMFEQENQRLYDDMSTLADEVRHIEGQVMEISKLQEIFTSKILQQDHDLDRVTNTVVHTTENIKSANEDIREAMKKNASFRAWILFFLIVMAFSLLFLDWYNP